MGLFGHFGALCAFGASGRAADQSNLPGAMVCLILASISVPVTDVFYYLKANTGAGGTLKLGKCVIFWPGCPA